MKKICVIAAALAACVSCSVQENAYVEESAGGGTGLISVRIEGVTPTKAADSSIESHLSDVQIMVFNSSDELYRYHKLDSGELTSGTCALAGIKEGTYSVYVVANGPALEASVRNRADLLATDIKLGEYNDTASDFVMEGCSEGLAVTANKVTDAKIELERYVCRVTLSEITNGLPSSIGAMTVNYAVLSNVVGSQTIKGCDSPSLWYNKDCRLDETTRNEGHIIGTGTYTASCGGLTFASYKQSVANTKSISSVKCFYGYENRHTAAGSGFSDPFSEKATALVLSVTFSVDKTSHTYYYNVPMTGGSAGTGILRNHSYDVKVKIIGAGSDEPGVTVGKGSLSVQITVKDWSDGVSTVVEI